MFKKLFTESIKYYKVYYSGDAEGSLVVKANNSKEAEGIFNKEKKTLFKKGRYVETDGIEETNDKFDISLAINEGSVSTMKYLRADNKEIIITYEVRGNKAFFKVPARNVNDKYSKTKMSDEIVVSKNKFSKKFDPELEIFNWLKSINY